MTKKLYASKHTRGINEEKPGKRISRDIQEQIKEGLEAHNAQKQQVFALQALEDNYVDDAYYFPEDDTYSEVSSHHDDSYEDYDAQTKEQEATVKVENTLNQHRMIVDEDSEDEQEAFNHKESRAQKHQQDGYFKHRLFHHKTVGKGLDCGNKSDTAPTPP